MFRIKLKLGTSKVRFWIMNHGKFGSFGAKIFETFEILESYIILQVFVLPRMEWYILAEEKLIIQPKNLLLFLNKQSKMLQILLPMLSCQCPSKMILNSNSLLLNNWWSPFLPLFLLIRNMS